MQATATRTVSESPSEALVAAARLMGVYRSGYRRKRLLEYIETSLRNIGLIDEVKAHFSELFAINDVDRRRDQIEQYIEDLGDDFERVYTAAIAPDPAA